MQGKWIYLAQRNPRLGREQFVERWLKHRTLGAPPAMGREFLTADYMAVRAAPVPAEGLSDEYDAVGLFALRGISSIPTVAQFLKLDHIQADEKRFFTTTSDSFSIFAAEKVVREGEPTPYLIVQFLRRDREVSPCDFERRWEEQAPSVLEAPAFGGAIARYIQNVVIAPPPPGYGYDGVAELWFSDAESMIAAATQLGAAMKAWPELDHRNSFCVAGDLIASRPRKT